MSLKIVCKIQQYLAFLRPVIGNPLLLFILKLGTYEPDTGHLHICLDIYKDCL